MSICASIIFCTVLSPVFRAVELHRAFILHMFRTGRYYFPEYTTGSGINNKAAKYILWRFMQTYRVRLSGYP